MPCPFDGPYHDAVWGTPVTDSSGLFAQLSLCTQQCGVSWRIVWNKRHHYEEAFHSWDVRKVAAMGEADLEGLCDKSGPWAGKLIQNRAKLWAIIHNAKQIAQIEDAVPGGLAGFLWSFVASEGGSAGAGGGAPLLAVRIAGIDGALAVAPRFLNADEAPNAEGFGVTSELSDRLTAVLKRRDGHAESAHFAEAFKFLGSTTLQAFLLQVGLLNGHAPDCAKNPRCHAGSNKRARSCKAPGRGEDAEPVTARRRRGGDVDEVWL